MRGLLGISVVAVVPLLLAGAPKKGSTPKPSPTAVDEVLSGRLVAESISVSAIDTATVIATEVLELLGYQTAPGFGSDSVETKWRVTETETPPRTARRYRISVSPNDTDGKTPYCFVRLEVEETSQVDEGEQRFAWRSWGPARATKEERAAFAAVVDALKKRLPKPDPNAPPPGDDSEPIPTARKVSLPEDGSPLDITDLGIVPVAIYQPAPPYPAIARNANLSGSVVVEIVVDVTGTVTDLKIVKSQPPFDMPVIDTLKKWRYQPLIVEGKPIKWKMRMTQNFTLR